MFLPFKYVNPKVNNGPVFANNVAFAMEVFLTPQKKHAKWRPRKTPANIVALFALFVKGAVSVIKL